jgi:biofilm PGA synthesis N-glycosyltransferase PgaC
VQPDVNSLTYALVTPARNEETYIAQTIEAVLAQTKRPARWVIVSDGSVDRTDEIVSAYARRHSIIELLRPAEQRAKNFGSKAKAFKAGYDRLQNTAYDLVGNLDADVTFGREYYETILSQFHLDAALGVAGGIILERIDDEFVPQRISQDSVAGAVQLFRRECFEATGGYIPIKGGGIDAAIEIVARMHGWKVRTFPESPVLHHRRVSTGKGSILSTRFQQGVTNYRLGYHPVFQIVSAAYRSVDRPYAIGGAMIVLGYAWSALRRDEQPLSPEIVNFLRSEQLGRLSRLARRSTRIEAGAPPTPSK